MGKNWKKPQEEQQRRIPFVQNFGPEQEISTPTGQKIITFTVDIYGPQRMICYAFDNPL